MSSARLKDLKDEVAAVRRRLEGWAARLAELRQRAAGGVDAGAPRPIEPPRSAPAPLFGSLGVGAGALDDVELTFEVLDTEDPGRSRG